MGRIDGILLEFVDSFVDKALDKYAGKEKDEWSDSIYNSGLFNSLLCWDFHVDNDKAEKVVAMLDTVFGDKVVKCTAGNNQNYSDENDEVFVNFVEQRVSYS